MARIAKTDRLAVLDDVRHHQHFRMPCQLKLVQHVNLQRAKAPAEGNLLFRRDALIAKHQHVIVEMRPMYAREIFITEGLTQIESEHFGAYGAIKSTDLNGLSESRRSRARGQRRRSSNRHTNLFIQAGQGRRVWRDGINLPVRGKDSNESNPIRLSAEVINQTLDWMSFAVKGQ